MQNQDYKQPMFTRYLYEFDHVKYSLLESVREKKREEALFWAYELYHSGFREEIWQCIREELAKYSQKLERRLNTFYAEWQETGDACLIGTVVGTLTIRDPESKEREEEDKQCTKKFIILYKEDRHQTVSVNSARNYLKQVSKYPIRTRLSVNEQSAYLGINWLYYCAKTPIWRSRILEGGGKILILDGEERLIAFENDDLLEEFYERWGFEPDEQSVDVHEFHGVYL